MPHHHQNHPRKKGRGFGSPMPHGIMMPTKYIRSSPGGNLDYDDIMPPVMLPHDDIMPPRPMLRPKKPSAKKPARTARRPARNIKRKTTSTSRSKTPVQKRGKTPVQKRGKTPVRRRSSKKMTPKDRAESRERLMKPKRPRSTGAKRRTPRQLKSEYNNIISELEDM